MYEIDPSDKWIVPQLTKGIYCKSDHAIDAWTRGYARHLVKQLSDGNGVLRVRALAADVVSLLRPPKL